MSPDQLWLACAEDLESRRQYRIAVRNLQTGEWLTEEISNTSGELVWTADSQAFFYVRLDPQTLLPCEVWLHRLGTEPAEDELVYREPDDSYDLSIYLTRSEQYVAIHLQSTLSSEVRLIPASHPRTEPVPLIPRQPEHEYELDHYQGHYYLRSNREGRNFGLYRSAEATPEQWQTLLAPREEVLLQEVELFRDGLLVEERSRGLTLLRQINCTASTVIATNGNFTFASAGQKVATIKSAPFAVAQTHVITSYSIHYTKLYDGKGGM